MGDGGRSMTDLICLTTCAAVVLMLTMILRSMEEER